MALLSNAFGDQRIEGQSLDDRRYAHRVEALSPLTTVASTMAYPMSGSFRRLQTTASTPFTQVS